MNHPSELTEFFDENVGRYRRKHKGSGLICDTLMAIGKTSKGTAKNVKKTAAKTVAEKAGQKVGEFAVEKGSKQIQQILQKRKPKQATQELANIFQNRVPQALSATLKLNRILANKI